MDEPKFIIEEINDPVANAPFHAQREQFRKNSRWLSAHWADVLPRALGKYVAVAGQEAFIHDDPLEAERLASEAHPEDRGVFCKYVNPQKGRRMYGNFGRMEGL